jgi:hypothetical protein
LIEHIYGHLRDFKLAENTGSAIQVGFVICRNPDLLNPPFSLHIFELFSRRLGLVLGQLRPVMNQAVSETNLPQLSEAGL